VKGELGTAVPVKVFGITVYHAAIPGPAKAGAPAASPAPAKSNGAAASASSAPASTAAGAASDPMKMGPVSLDKIQLQVDNVEFADGKVNLGSAGTLTTAPGSKVSLSGNLQNLRLSGHANIANLAFDGGGTRLQGAKGTGDIDATFQGLGDGSGKVTASLTNLNLQTDYAVSERANGDFIALASGKIQNGSLKMEEHVGKAFSPDAPTLDSLDIGKFDGMLAGGRITLPDGKHTSQVTLGKSTLSGDVHVTPDRILVNGKVDMQAAIQNYQAGNAGANFDLGKVEVHGRGDATLDSKVGLKLKKGALDVQADVMNAQFKSPAGETASTKVAKGSTVKLQASELDFTKDKGLEVKGRGEVNLELQNLKLGRRGVALSGNDAKVSGQADIVLDDKGVSLNRSNLQLDAALNDGHVQIGDTIDLHLKAGTEIHAALAAAAFSKSGSEVQMRPGTSISAELQSGKVTLPGNQKVSLKAGAKVTFTFDQLNLGENGWPQATGTMVLDAVLDEDQIDLPAAGVLPGVNLKPLTGTEQHVTITLGKFTIRPDGSFDVGDMRFGIQAVVSHFGGSFTGPPPAPPPPPTT
jgi:hypothetical protein